MINKYLSVIMLVCAAVTFSSCKKDKSDNPEPEGSSDLSAVTVRNLLAIPDSLRGHFAFFNFKKNKVVPYTDSVSTRWDIAFNKTIIIINGGNSGPGSGEALVYTGLFDDLIKAPLTGYKFDNASGKAITTGSGNGWYNYSGAPKHIITPIAGRVLIVKTAEGKYAKVEILSYYKDAPAEPAVQDPTSGWYTFRYVYQDNGSPDFK